MYYELEVKIASGEKTIFLRDRMDIFETKDSPLHDHAFSEVHVILEGEVGFSFEKENITLCAGDIIVIPPKCNHAVTKNGNKSFVLGMRENVGRVMQSSVCEPVIRDFVRETKNSVKSGNFSVLSSYIAFFCAPFFRSEAVAVKECDDQGFIIEDFFNTRYADDAKLSELAQELRLSEKQTARLVAKHTGRSFKDELRYRKVVAAQTLADTSDMSMSEIADHVGYTSYSSLWKAMQKYKQ